MKVGSFQEFARTVAIAARNVCLGSNLESLALARHPRTLVFHSTELRFYGRALRGRRGLQVRNVFDTLSAADEVQVILGNLSGDTWFHGSPSYLMDLVALCSICQLVRPSTVFEIGTLHGYTALHIALNTQMSTRIFTLDLPRGFAATALPTTLGDARHIDRSMESTRYVFDGKPVAEKITCLSGDSATFDFSPYVGSVDLFFIDGAHSYDYVRSDTLNALKCCKPGSVIAWHDYGRIGVNGVTRWLKEFARRQPTFLVPGGLLAYAVLDS